MAGGFGLAAAGPVAAGPEVDDCAAIRDRALRPLLEEVIAIESTFDNDAAVSGAAEYHLEEARKALIADIDRQRADVERSFRHCTAGDPSRTGK